jgi:hypothetical protein
MEGWRDGEGAMMMQRERKACVVQERGKRTHLEIRTSTVDADIYKWTTD